MSTCDRLLLCAAMLTSALTAAPARATYSLLIADRATGLIGSVGTSCVGRQAVSAISGIAPGLGAIHAQAYSHAGGRDRGVQMLEAGATAAEIIAAITDLSFDILAASRQYGVVGLVGGAAGYTGSSNGAFADDRQETLGDYVTSYQGNILTGAEVLTQIGESLRSGEGCDLPDTLMRALEAGARDGQGDSRCTTSGIPADSGFLKVVDRDGKVLISIEVTNERADGAVVALREAFDLWRTTNRCKATADAGIAADAGALPREDAGAGALDARVPDAGGPSANDARAPAAREDAAREDAARADATVEDAGGLDAQGEDGPDEDRTSDDTGCRVGSSSGTGALFALAAVIALRGRRRRRTPDQSGAPKSCTQRLLP